MKTFKFILLAAFASFLFSCQVKTTEAAKSDCPKTEKKIGLQLYSVRDTIFKDFPGTIKALAAMGFTDVEAANYKDTLSGLFYGLTPEEFAAQLKAVGLNPLSSHVGHLLGDDPSKANWDEVWKWWDTCIAAHKAAGFKYLVFPWMPVPKTLADLKIYCDYLNKIGEKCNQAGITFGYHNHSHEFQKIEGETMYDFMLKNTDPSKVFFEMDVYWTVMGQNSPVAYFNKYPGRFKMLHIKDQKELGQSGMVGFDAIYKNINTAGAIYSIIEIEEYNYPMFEGLKMSLDYLQTAPF